MRTNAVYTGTIRHRRFAERERTFEHRITMVYGDVDDDAARTVRAATGVEARGGVRLLTQRRTLGHSFNPVSFYYCFDDEQRLEAVLAEVTNTPWGERETYVLYGSDLVVKGTSEKTMHVSPFFGTDQTYDWRVGVPGETLSVHIENWERGTKAFDATLKMRREERTRTALAKAAATSLKTLPLIYAHAAAIRLSGIKAGRKHPTGQRGLSPISKRLRSRAPARETPHG